MPTSCWTDALIRTKDSGFALAGGIGDFFDTDMFLVKIAPDSGTSSTSQSLSFTSISSLSSTSDETEPKNTAIGGFEIQIALISILILYQWYNYQKKR